MTLAERELRKALRDLLCSIPDDPEYVTDKEIGRHERAIQNAQRALASTGPTPIPRKATRKP